MAIVSGSSSPQRGVATDQTLDYGGTTQVLVRDVGSKIFYLDPSAAPFTLLSDRAGSKPATNPKFEWYEKALRPKQDTVGTATADTTTGTLEADNLSYFQVNDLVLDATTAEIFKVTAVNDTNLTVVRGAAGSTAVNIGQSDDLFVIGSAWAEGADVGIPDEWQEVQKFNFTQIFRRPFGASRTRESSETYFGQTRPKLRGEKAIEHAIDIERAFMFGGRSENTGTLNNPYRTSGGFTYWATSNVVDLAGGSLTEPDLESELEDVFAHTASGDSRTVFASAQCISALDMLAVNKLRTVIGETTYGMKVKQYETSHGTLNIVKHRLLTDGTNGSGFGDYMFIVDPKMLKARPLSGGTTVLKVDRQGNGVDGWVDEYLTEMGLQFSNAEVHGIIKNVGAAT